MEVEIGGVEDRENQWGRNWRATLIKTHEILSQYKHYQFLKFNHSEMQPLSYKKPELCTWQK